MKILAIDPAATTGYCSETESGIWVVNLPKWKFSKGQKLEFFFNYLKPYITNNDIELVVYEKPGGTHYNGLRSHANFEALILLACSQAGILAQEYSAKTIKKYITGNGNSKKEAVVQAVKKLGYKPQDDNEADAIALYLLAKSELG